MSQTKYAWAAGFFDGEGHIYINKGHKCSFAFGLSLTQKDRKPLDEFQSIFGGSLQALNPRKRDGRVYYRLTISSVPGKEALEKMLPFLILKKREAEIAISFQARRRRGRGVIDAIQDQKDYMEMKQCRMPS